MRWNRDKFQDKFQVYNTVIITVTATTTKDCYKIAKNTKILKIPR